MKRLGLTLLVLAIVSGVTYYVFTHPGVDRAERLEKEVAQLESENEKLAEKNEHLEKRVSALKKDPRLAERKVRESVGFVRPDELIFQFEKPEEDVEVRVVLEVGEETLQLAGQKVRLTDLKESLAKLDDDVARSTLVVEFAPKTDALRREQVREIVEHSTLAPAKYRERGLGRN